MTKTFITISLLFFGIIFGQSLQSISPDNALQGQELSVTITGRIPILDRERPLFGLRKTVQPFMVQTMDMEEVVILQQIQISQFHLMLRLAFGM